MNELKYCPGCKKDKPLSEFGFDKNTKDGYRRLCKVCNNAAARKYLASHRDIINEKKRIQRIEKGDSIRLASREYYKSHKEQIKESNKKYRESHKEEVAERKRNYKKRNSERWKEYHAEYYQQHRDDLRMKQRQYREKNRESINAHQRMYRESHKEAINAYNRNRRSVDEKFRIITDTRGFLWSSLKYNRDSPKLRRLIGCSLQEFKQHLETTFKDNMTWDNYGEWNIDHIIPCICFDVTDEIQLLKCFNYKNLQALWGKENSSKNDKLPDGTLGRTVNTIDEIKNNQFSNRKLIESYEA